MLVTTLTKRMAEDLAEYYTEVGVKCAYLHSEVTTLDRIKILRDLRRGDLRCADRRQSAARRSGSAGGVAGRDSGCR